MKAYKKSDLVYKDGYIMKGDDIIVIDPSIVNALNKLDIDVQKAKFERDRKHKAVLLQSVMEEEFEPESEYPHVFPKVETPWLDDVVEQTVHIMHEIDEVNKADMACEYANNIDAAVQFCNGDMVVECASFCWRFDLPTLGNPLELSGDKLLEFISGMFDE